MIKSEWLRLIIVNPIDGINNVVTIFSNAILYLKAHIIRCDDVGLQYFFYLIFTFVLAVLFVKDKIKRLEWLPWLIVNISFLFAIVLFYDVRVGSRHLMPFIVVEAVLLLGNIKFYTRAMLCVLVFGGCFLNFSDSYVITYPKYTKNMDALLTDINYTLKDKINISEQSEWDNTVIWVLSDVDGNYPWQTLYALPAGMGINLCTYQYVVDNFANLSSRYIACTAGGEISKKCVMAGHKELLRMDKENICVYQLR